MFKRLVHVFTEIERVEKSKAYLLEGDYSRLGKEFHVSHESSRNLYEVSCRELDLMVDIGSKFTGVLGSKLTGAGFGGCTIHLVERRLVDKFVEYMKEKYSEATGIVPDVFRIELSDGVTLI
jgi:galactokinase